MSELATLTETLLAIVQNSRGWNVALLALSAFVASTLGANLSWRIANAPQGQFAQTARAWAAQRGMRALYQTARLAFYLGLPFMALYLGWMDLRSIGLGALDWAEGMRWAIVILLAAWLLLMLIWLPYLRATADVPASDAQFSFARRMVEMIYMQAHWMFYRGAAITLLTGVVTDAFYWGAIIGLGLTCLEAALDPRLGARLQHIGAADGAIWNLGQAFLNALAFLATHNLGLGLLIQFLLEVTVPHLRSTRAAPRKFAVTQAPPRPTHK
ncbi:hypothetical protein FBQ82_05460 [Anaerolineae bacterium CFX7]|nr:hypothetical protein [Anaerolineae bacterium CFX7]